MLGISSAEAAKIRVFKKTSEGVSISLHGKIVRGDNKKLFGVLARYRPQNAALFLSSEGGQVREAMTIGYTVRKFGIITVIAKNSKCLSACALIFMAGWDKLNGEPYRVKHPRGKLGLHHPWHERTRKKMPKEQMLILKHYFEFVQAGEGMYRLMEQTHQRSIKFVNNKRLRQLSGYFVRSGQIDWPRLEFDELVICHRPNC